MIEQRDKRKYNDLHGIAKFTLFISSYCPLFLLLIMRHLFTNSEYLNWGGISWEAIKIFISKFGVSTILIVLIIIGLFGYWKTMRNIGEVAPNGYPVTITDIKNNNSEIIGYIATYLIPLSFQSFNGWYEYFATIFLLLIIYRIYIHSSLILVNPILSFKFGLYEIEYTSQNGRKKKGLIISTNKFLEEDCVIKLYEIGHKLYFATDKN